MTLPFITLCQFAGALLELQYHIKWVIPGYHVEEYDSISTISFVLFVVDFCFYGYFCFWNSRKKKLMTILYSACNLIMLFTLGISLFSLTKLEGSPLDIFYVVSSVIEYAFPMVVFLFLYTLLWKFKDLRMWLAKKMHNAQRI